MNHEDRGPSPAWARLAVMVGRTWMLSGEIVEIRATVTGKADGSDLDIGMWHKFLQPGERWPMAELAA